MINVGLTGNIASGKSTVAALFAEWGATVFDADAIVREVQSPGSPVLEAIARRFGDAVVRADGALDRAALRHRVAGDEDALGALNAIVHPAVHRERDRLMAEAEGRGDLLVVNEIPLLFEVMDPAVFDAVVLVDAPESVRLVRLCETRGLDDEEARRLIASQMPSAAKRPRSTHVIDNVGSRDALAAAARPVFESLRRAAARQGVAGGRLLALFAHPDDESFAMAGTLARYADAGVEIHLVCSTAGEAGTGRGGETGAELGAVRTAELHHAGELMGLSAIEVLGLPDGELAGLGDDAVSRYVEILRRVRPDAIVTFGADGVTGHSDHVTLHRWVAAARDAAAFSGPCYFVTYPVEVAGPIGLTGRSRDEIDVVIDVRPWQDVKRAAIAAHASQRFPFDLDGHPARRLLEREWFVRSGGGSGDAHGFFDGPGRA